MLQFFSIPWRLIAGACTRRFHVGRMPPCQAPDLLAHPAIATMSERELADLPFPRDLREGCARPARAACRGAR